MFLNEYEVTDIVSIKLISGDELIGQVSTTTDSADIILSKPLLVVLTPQGKTFLPALLSGNPNEDIIVDNKKILYHAHTDERDKQAYIKMTTGIDIPNKKIILD